MLAFNGQGIEVLCIGLFVKNYKLIFILSELLSQVRISGYFRGNGHSFVKAGEKGDKIRDQHRSTGTHGDGAFFSVILPDLFDHGFLLHEQVPGVLYCKFPVFIEGKPALLPVKEFYAQFVFQPLHGAAQGRLGDMELFRRCRQSAAGSEGYKLFEQVDFNHKQIPFIVPGVYSCPEFAFVRHENVRKVHITVFYRNQDLKTSLRINCCEERGIEKKEEVRMQERKENSKQSLTLRNGVSMPLLGFGVLQLDYIDLYLIHQPYSDYYGAWRTLEKLYKDGKVRAIGVSNFSPERLTDLCLNSEVPPMVNQVELHPFYHQDDALRIMKELGVQPQAWAPLCEGLKNIFSNKILEKTGMKYGKTAAQTALRWNIDRGVSVVTRSSVPEHMGEDQDIWDFSLTEAELSAIDQLDLGYSEILDYGNPCIARMFLKKRGIQEEKDDRVIL